MAIFWQFFLHFCFMTKICWPPLRISKLSVPPSHCFFTQTKLNENHFNVKHNLDNHYKGVNAKLHIGNKSCSFAHWRRPFLFQFNFLILIFYHLICIILVKDKCLKYTFFSIALHKKTFVQVLRSHHIFPNALLTSHFSNA